MGQRRVTKLKVAIVSSGFTLKEIAAKADVRENDLSRYARGVVQPRIEVAARIAGALNTTVEDLFSADDEDTRAAA